MVLSFCFFLVEGCLLPLLPLKHPYFWKPIQKHIQDLFKHPRWSFFAKIMNSFSFLTIFAKSSFIDVWQDFNFPIPCVLYLFSTVAHNYYNMTKRNTVNLLDPRLFCKNDKKKSTKAHICKNQIFLVNIIIRNCTYILKPY